jgi:hypothetical protein
MIPVFCVAAVSTPRIIQATNIKSRCHLVTADVAIAATMKRGECLCAVPSTPIAVIQRANSVLSQSSQQPGSKIFESQSLEQWIIFAMLFLAHQSSYDYQNLTN